MENTCQVSTQAVERRKIVTCDQESWVMQRIMCAMRMAVAMKAEVIVRANEDSYDYGLRGVAEGTAREIIHTLGLEPEYTNIRRLIDVR